ncbi:hypothetical protein D3C86_1638500 [compost metagenome]
MLNPAQQQILAVEAAGFHHQQAPLLGVYPPLQLALSEGDIDLHRPFFCLIGRNPGAQPIRQLAHLGVQILQQQAAEPPLGQQAGELQPLATH